VDIVDRGIEIDKLKKRMMKMYESLGGPKGTPDQRMRIWEAIKDDVDPKGQMRRAFEQAQRQMTYKAQVTARAEQEKQKMTKTVETITAPTEKEFKSQVKGLTDLELTDIIDLLGEQITAAQAQPSGGPGDQLRLAQAQQRYVLAQQTFADRQAKAKRKGKQPSLFRGILTSAMNEKLQSEAVEMMLKRK
jgi:hypothetical protein